MFELFSEKTLEKAYALKTLPEFLFWNSDDSAVNMEKKIFDGVDSQKTFYEIMKDVPVDAIAKEWMNFYIATFSATGCAGQFNALVLEAEFPSVDVDSVLKQSILNATRKKKNAFFEFMKRRVHAANKLDGVVANCRATDRIVESMAVVVRMARSENANLFSLVQRADPTDRVPLLALDGVFKVSPNFDAAADCCHDGAGCWALLECQTLVSIDQTDSEFVFKFSEKTPHVEDALIECGLLERPYSTSRLSNVCYYVPGVDVCMWYFIDFLMLDCSNVAVSEKNSQTGEKWLLKFLFQKTLTVRLVHKTVDSQCKTLRLFGNETFSLGSTFLKISISKAASERDETCVVQALLKLLTVFQETRAADIRDDYLEILPRFPFQQSVATDDEDGAQKNNRLLKLSAPDMFVTDYPRKCLHLPRIVEDDEAARLTSRNVPLLRFPAKGEGGRAPKWFACDHHPAAPFPGLRKNPLRNKDVFPVLPCCYIGDQSERRGSEYRIYYHNDLKHVKARKPNEYIVFTTNRCLPENVFGQLPREIALLFPSSVFAQYYRLGVSKTLVSCLERATGVPFSGSPTSDELNVCRQESNREPLAFNRAEPLQLLAYYERYFRVNIVVFSDSARGGFEFASRGRAGYLSGDRYDNYVAIVCNKGTVADDLATPQFELVVCVVDDDKTRPKTIFAVGELSSLDIAVQKFYNIRYAPLVQGQIVGQHLDSFGKMRAAIFADGSVRHFDHYRPHPEAVPVLDEPRARGVLDDFKDVVVRAAAIEHAFHYWGREEFLARVFRSSQQPPLEPSRLVLDTIAIDSDETLERVLALQRRSVSKIQEPQFLSQLRSRDDQLVFRDRQTLLKHFETRTDFLTHTVGGKAMAFRLAAEPIKFDQPGGGVIFGTDAKFKTIAKYRWGQERNVWLVFEDKLYESVE